MDASGNVALKLQDKVGRASRAFGALRGSVFCDKNLSLITKRMVYCSMVLGVLLYGTESKAIKKPTIRRLNRCMHCILGLSRAEQWIRHLIRTMLGMETSMKSFII